MYYIKKHGVEKFIEQQSERIKLLEEMLEEFNEGRSRSFYCIATALLSVEDVKKSIDSAKKEVKSLGVRKDDVKSKAKILRKTIQNIADKKGIDLKLRKPTK